MLPLKISFTAFRMLYIMQNMQVPDLDLIIFKLVPFITRHAITLECEEFVDLHCLKLCFFLENQEKVSPGNAVSL